MDSRFPILNGLVEKIYGIRTNISKNQFIAYRIDLQPYGKGFIIVIPKSNELGMANTVNKNCEK